MKVTKRSISAIFGVPLSAIEQIGAKQLFIVVKDNIKFLVSYRTIIGIYHYNDTIWLLTTKKYSVTTSRQLSTFPYLNRRISNDALIGYLPTTLQHYAK